MVTLRNYGVNENNFLLFIMTQDLFYFKIYHEEQCFVFFCSRERMSRLLLPFADQHIEIPSLSAGNIALTVGLKQVNNFHGTRNSVVYMIV